MQLKSILYFNVLIANLRISIMYIHTYVAFINEQTFKCFNILFVCALDTYVAIYVVQSKMCYLAGTKFCCYMYIINVFINSFLDNT